jgi:hypothetical protein
MGQQLSIPFNQTTPDLQATKTAVSVSTIRQNFIYPFELLGRKAFAKPKTRSFSLLTNSMGVTFKTSLRKLHYIRGHP